MTEETLHVAIRRVGAQHGALLRAALYLVTDELVLCVFEASSRESVKRLSEEAGMPCERVIETVWVAPGEKGERCPEGS